MNGYINIGIRWQPAEGLLAVRSRSPVALLQFPYPPAWAADAGEIFTLPDARPTHPKRFGQRYGQHPRRSSAKPLHGWDRIGCVFNQPMAWPLTPRVMFMWPIRPMRRFVKITSTGVVITVAGSPVNRGNRDGTGTRSLPRSSPCYVTIRHRTSGMIDSRIRQLR